MLIFFFVCNEYIWMVKKDVMKIFEFRCNEDFWIKGNKVWLSGNLVL